jgi:hypothetical protein
MDCKGLGPAGVGLGLISILFLVPAGPATAANGAFPWKAGDPPPAVRRIALGDTEHRVLTTFGIPSDAARSGLNDLYDYPAGLEIIANQQVGVTIIRLRARQAGAIGGVRVGDQIRSVVAKWGKPDSDGSEIALYKAGLWVVALKVAPDNGQVTDLLLGWATQSAANAQANAAPSNTVN